MTFITPLGHFRYRRGPMGFVLTGDTYNLKGDLALDGIKQTRKIVDDILVQDKNLNEHVPRVRMILDRCREHNITLNPKKFRFAQS